MNRIFLLLLLITIGCTKHNVDPAPDPCEANLNETFESCSTTLNVASNKCIIKEASISDQNGIVVDRYVYHHNGTNYDTIYRHYNEYNTTPYSPNPAEMITLAYKNGFIYQVRFFSAIFDKTGVMRPSYQLTFSYLNSRLITHTASLGSDGSVGGFYAYDNQQFYTLAPKDSLYFFNEVANGGGDTRGLFDYKGNNFIREGVPSSKGFCTLYNVIWLFVKSYYDDVPNVLKDYAVRYPINVGKGLYGYMTDPYVEINKNNMIGQTYNDGTRDGTWQYCWTFLKNTSEQYWIKTFTVDNGATITYQYDCE